MGKDYFSYKLQRNAIVLLSSFLLISFYFLKDYSIPLRVLSAVSFLLFFHIVDYFFDIRFKKFHYFLAVLIMIFGFLLSNFYFLYSQYDKILHFFMPLMTGSLIFYMVSKLKLDLKWKLAFTLFILMAIIGYAEVGEYLLDLFFDLKLQGVYLRGIGGFEKFSLLQDRIDDTMIDMIIGLIGSLTFILYKKFSYKN